MLHKTSLSAALGSLATACLLAFVLLSPTISSAQDGAAQVEAAHQAVVEAYGAGDYNRALSLAEEALELSERVLGPENPSTLTSVNNLAFLYDATGRYGEAEPLYRRALEARERLLGPEHPSTLTSVNNLALFYNATGRYEEAEPLYRRALEARERVLGPEHPDTLSSINNLAFLYYATGRYGKAEPLFRRALEARERVRGPEHPDTAGSVNNLAGLYRATGRYGEAEPLFRSALQARERVLGPEHPDTIGSVNNLAGLYQATGRHGEAEPLFRRALEASERVLGPEHPDTLTGVNNLASIYEATGRYGEAERLNRRALEARERMLGPEHPGTLTSVNNLASLYQATGRYGEAEPLFRRALEAFERVFGPEHPDTLTTFNNLASIYKATGRYGEADPLYRRVLETYESVLGPEHPDTLRGVNNLAALYQTTGRYREAEPLFRHAFEAFERVLGPEHPNTLTSINNLAGLYTASGRHVEAASTLADGVKRSRRWAEQEADAASGAGQRLAALKRGGESDALALALAAHAPMAETADLAALVVLNRKGLVGEREAALLRLTRTTKDDAVRQIAADLLVARQDLAAAYRGVSRGDGGEAAEQTFQTITERVDGLERDLAQADASYRAPRDVTAEEVIAALPPGAVLIDYTLFTPYDFKARAWAEGQHVGAVALRQGAEAVFVDLGPLTTLLPTIESLSATLGAGDAGKIAGRKLHRALMAPLAEHLAGAKTLFISPAGPLGLIPFDMLRTSPSDQSTLAASGPALRLLATGRALVADEPEQTGQGLMAFGAVDYEQTGGAAPRPDVTEETLLALVERARGSTAETAVRAGKLQAFQPLPQTAVELDDIARIWREAGGEAASLHVGKNAREGLLTSLAGAPRVLHLATHGFVEETEVVGARAALLTGVALAGANSKTGDTEAGVDGVLFGYEIEALALTGTELVVVSACETGRGRVDATEGVYSLARGFRLAGAGAVLVTLKQVDDALTAAFMADFYQAWLGTPGATPTEALASTKRAWAQSPNPRQSQPGTWAAFILVENRV